MTFNADQISHLSGPLTKDHVKKNPRGFDYVEGWHAIAEANRIFGFGEWDRLTEELRQLGEPREVDGKQRVAYFARVRIIVRANGAIVTRDGCGYGSGIDKDLGQAHESGIKEAETDAMKRALMTFGNPFGLALYDKAQANVVNAPSAACQAAITLLNEAKTGAAFKEAWEKNKAGWKAGLSAEDYARVVQTMQSVAIMWTPKAEAA